MTVHKYLKDGRKVAVLGKLNSGESIVQEIFIDVGGGEFPGGENFVAKGLLDKPAETFADREISRKAEVLADLKKSIDNAEKGLRDVEMRLRKTNLYDGFLALYQDKTPKDIQTLLAFMSGQITHVVFEEWGAPEIVELLDALANEFEGRFYGLNLVSLFGVNPDRCDRSMRNDDDSQLGLEWRINEYYDGSGISRRIHPCRSLEGAIEIVDKILAEKNVSQETIDMKKKYGLENPTDDRIRQWRQKVRKSAEERIAKLTAEIAELREI